MYTLIIKDIFNKDHVFPNKNIEECLPLKQTAEQYVKQFLAATIISADGQIISKYVPQNLNQAGKFKREDCIVKPPKQKDNIKSNKIGKKVNMTEPKITRVSVPKDCGTSCIGIGSILPDIKYSCDCENESKTIKNDDRKICKCDDNEPDQKITGSKFDEFTQEYKRDFKATLSSDSPGPERSAKLKKMSEQYQAKMATLPKCSKIIGTQLENEDFLRPIDEIFTTEQPDTKSENKSQDETPNDFWSNFSNMPELVNIAKNISAAPDTKRINWQDINFKNVLIVYLDYVIDHYKDDAKWKNSIPYIVVVKEWLKSEKQDLYVLVSNLIKVKMPAA